MIPRSTYSRLAAELRKEVQAGFFDGLHSSIHLPFIGDAQTSSHEREHERITHQTSDGKLLLISTLLMQSHTLSRTHHDAVRDNLRLLFDSSRLAHERFATYIGIQDLKSRDICVAATDLVDEYREYFRALAEVVDNVSPCKIVRRLVAMALADACFQSTAIERLTPRGLLDRISLNEHERPSSRLDAFLSDSPIDRLKLAMDGARSRALAQFRQQGLTLWDLDDEAEWLKHADGSPIFEFIIPTIHELLLPQMLGGSARTDESMRWFEKAGEDLSGHISYGKLSPISHPLRIAVASDPDFAMRWQHASTLVVNVPDRGDWPDLLTLPASEQNHALGTGTLMMRRFANDNQGFVLAYRDIIGQPCFVSVTEPYGNYLIGVILSQLCDDKPAVVSLRLIWHATSSLQFPRAPDGSLIPSDKLGLECFGYLQCNLFNLIEEHGQYPVEWAGLLVADPSIPGTSYDATGGHDRRVPLCIIALRLPNVLGVLFRVLPTPVLTDIEELLRKMDAMGYSKEMSADQKSRCFELLRDPLALVKIFREDL